MLYRKAGAVAALATCALTLAPAAAGAETPAVAALRIDQPLRVDGVLDEEAWQRAPVAGGFIQREPDEGAPARDATTFQVVYTPTTLYFAIRCADRNPEQVVAKELQRDGNVVLDDAVTILLDTFHDGRNAYFFETNVNGTRFDGLVTDEGRDFNIEWDGIWDAAGRVGTNGWTVEVAIPVATLRFDPAGEVWGLQVHRIAQDTKEDTYWAPLPFEYDIFRMSLAGDLTGLGDLEPGLNLQVKPFAVGTDADAEQGAPPRVTEDLELGVDVKWAITRGLNLDLTYNTDFAEAEVDEERVNLTRFSLFFPEKREFFLENAGIFSFGQDPDFLSVFFSRRIGLDPSGQRVPMAWGARLTGRAGPWSIGILDAQTDRVGRDASGEPAIPENNWGVVRLKRNLGQRSNIGAIFTNSDPSGSGGGNQVYGLDLDLNPTDRLNVQTFWTRSDDAGRDGGNSDAFGASAAWTGQAWSYGLQLLEVQEDFNPEIGFLQRQGIRRYVPSVRYRKRPEDHAWIRNLSFGLDAEVVTTLDDEVETAIASVELFGVRSHREDSVSLFADLNHEQLFEPFEIVPGVEIAAGEYDFNTIGVDLLTNESRRLSVADTLVYGDFFDGTRLSNDFTLLLRLSRHFQSATDWSYNDIELPGGSFTTHVIRQRFGVALSPDLFANAFVQYNDSEEVASLNVRVNWIYQPGSDLFIVYNEVFDAPSLGEVSSRDRQVIVKLTYLFEL